MEKAPPGWCQIALAYSQKLAYSRMEQMNKSTKGVGTSTWRGLGASARHWATESQRIAYRHFMTPDS